MSRSQASVLILVFCEEEERKVSMKAKFLTQLPLILSFAWKILLLICVGACHWHAFPLQNTSVCVCVCECSRKMQSSWARWHCMRMTDKSVYRPTWLCKGFGLCGIRIHSAEAFCYA